MASKVRYFLKLERTFLLQAISRVFWSPKGKPLLWYGI
jgi:hypothetical protein